MGYTSWTLSILTMIIVAPITKGIIECPTDEETWNTQASKFSCDATNGMSYHCIKTHENKLIEVCLRRKRIPSGTGGCPWVYNDSDGSVIFGAVNTICDDQTSCPQRNHTEYYSDQLYKYPSCIRRVNENTTSAPTSNVTQASNATCEPLKETSADVTIRILVMVIFFVIFCAILTIRVNKATKYMYQSTLEKVIPNKTQDLTDVTQQSTIEEKFNVDVHMKIKEERESDASKNNVEETSKSQKCCGRLKRPFMKEKFDVDFHMENKEEWESDASKNNFEETSKSQKCCCGRLIRPFMKVITNVVMCVVAYSTFSSFLFAGDVHYHGSKFNNSDVNINLCSCLLAGSTVLLCTICFCDTIGREKFYGNYFKITMFLYQALALNWILRQLIKAIFFAIENDENCNVESPFYLFICMALFYTLHLIFCWKSMSFTSKT